LARDFAFDGDLLVRAIQATFARRTTPLPTAAPVVFTAAFAEDQGKKTQWAGFVRKAGARDAGRLGETVAAVAAFGEPALMADARSTLRGKHWRPGGPWL
jgi:hypothetical protein